MREHSERRKSPLRYDQGAKILSQAQSGSYRCRFYMNVSKMTSEMLKKQRNLKFTRTNPVKYVFSASLLWLFIGLPVVTVRIKLQLRAIASGLFSMLTCQPSRPVVHLS